MNRREVYIARTMDRIARLARPRHDLALYPAGATPETWAVAAGLADDSPHDLLAPLRAMHLDEDHPPGLVALEALRRLCILGLIEATPQRTYRPIRARAVDIRAGTGLL